jgi:hypothetical protein
MNGETSGLLRRQYDSPRRADNSRVNWWLENRRYAKLSILPVVALCLTFCQGPGAPILTEHQRSELNFQVDAYDLCVAIMASRIDDGKSAVTRIADLAVVRCTSVERLVAAYLDRLDLPSSTKADYLVALTDMAARQSARMLRERRGAGWRANEL